MGTHFFQKPGAISGGSQNMEARAIGAGTYGAARAGGSAQKGISAAQAINKAGAFKPMKRSAAYPKGPKV